MEKEPFDLHFNKLLKNYPVRGYLFIFSVSFTLMAFGYVAYTPESMDIKGFVIHISIIALCFTLARFFSLLWLKFKHK